jgi:hypothetical protein
VQSYLRIPADTAGRPAVRAHGVSVHRAGTQLPSYCTGAAQAGAASTQTSRLTPGRHSFVLGRRFGNPLVCGVGGVGSDGEASRRGWLPGPTRPRRRSRLGASSTPVATVQADRGANRRFGARPPDRGSAPAPLSCPGHVLCLLRAARAIAVKSALVSIGRRNSRTAGPDGRRFVCLRGGRHRPRPVERHHEQARMVERVNRSAREGQNTHRAARRRAVRPNIAPRRGRGLSLISASMSRSSR